VRLPLAPSNWLRIAVLLLALGAAAARGETPPQTLSVVLGPTSTRLTFIEGQDAARLLGERRPPAVAVDSASERELVAYCSNGEPQRTQAEKGFVADLLSAVVGLVLDKTADRVRAELARYSSFAEQTSRIDFYRGGTTASGNGRLDSRYSCLRLTRFSTDPGKAGEVVLDFVAGIGLDTDRTAILLRPLRLFVSKATAHSATGRYGVAITIRADAVWREAVTGHQGVIFDQPVASESLDLSAGPFLSYYGTDPLGGLRVPIVPVSVDSDRSRDFGRTNFTVSVAEIGVPPAVLTLLAQYLPTTTDRRTRLLLEAAAIANQPLP
jgi:hypothetical protein